MQVKHKKDSSDNDDSPGHWTTVQQDSAQKYYSVSWSRSQALYGVDHAASLKVNTVSSTVTGTTCMKGAVSKDKIMSNGIEAPDAAESIDDI